MAIKRRLMLVVITLALPVTYLSAQTPEAKVKPSGSVSGRVTIGDKPAPGVLVAVSVMNSMSPLGQTTSDADGNYRIGGLAAGQVNVTPVAPAYVVPVNGMFGQGRVVNLAANETVDGIDFKLTRGGVITGRITDEDGRPAIEERITLLSVDENGNAARGQSFRASNFMMYQTDDRGVYRLYGLPAGHYKVGVGDEPGRNSGLRTAGYYLRTYYPDASDIAKAGIVDVSEGGETKNIDIKLGRRAAAYSVSGRIVDTDTGRPLGGIFFTLGVVQQSQNQSYVSGSSGPSNPTNSLGEFRVEGISPGRYVLLVSPPNFSMNPGSSPNFYNDPIPFEIVDSDVGNLEIKAQRGLSISGVVVPDGITDKNVLARMSRLIVSASVNPAAGEVTVRTYAGNSSTKVNPDGSFLIQGMRPGKVMLQIGDYSGPESMGVAMARIEHDGVVQNRGIDLRPGQDLSGVKIFITYGTGVIHGQLKVEGGTLPSDAIIFVNLSKQGEVNPLNAQVDSRGRFILKNIAPGTYDVILQIVTLGSQASPRGLARMQRQTVTVADGSDTEVFFMLDLSRKDTP